MNRHRSNHAHTAHVKRRTQKRAAQRQFAANSEHSHSALKMAINRLTSGVESQTRQPPYLKAGEAFGNMTNVRNLPPFLQVLNRWQPEPVEKRAYEFPVREWRRTG